MSLQPSLVSGAEGRRNYVVGFMFSRDRSRVILIEKKRPAWQAGRLNGVGGKTEANERASLAMIREFREETGAITGEFDWRRFASLRGEFGRVDCFVAFGDPTIVSETDELVGHYEVSRLGEYCCVSNLDWLVPLALQSSVRIVTAEY